MAILEFNNVGISGICACVPRNKINNYEQTQFFPAEDVKKVVDKIGVYERRIADAQTCSSDLCYAAAEKLIADMNIEKAEIDVLIFISQTPDFRMPATSILLQNRLGLSQSTIAFDLTLGCSAFLYGLSVGFQFLSQPHIKKVLLLDGETRSKVYSPKDRKTAFLFGDGGVAVLLERDKKYGKSTFSLNSNGEMADTIKINGGGYRNPSSSETLKEKVVDQYGNIRTDEQGYMDGETVFNFVSVQIPKDIKRLCAAANEDLQSMDFYLFHQANDFINQFLIKKLKIDKGRVPASISKFGNTSSVSIPLTIVSELQGKLSQNSKVLFSAFGVGLCWGTAILHLNDCHLSQMVEL